MMTGRRRWRDAEVSTMGSTQERYCLDEPSGLRVFVSASEVGQLPVVLVGIRDDEYSTIWLNTHEAIKVRDALNLLIAADFV